MQVTIQRVCGVRYAMIKTESKDWSIQLDPGVSIRHSLIDKANEYRARAARILAEADLLETASNLYKE